MKETVVGGIAGGILGSFCKKKEQSPTILIGVALGALAGVAYQKFVLAK